MGFWGTIAGLGGKWCVNSGTFGAHCRVNGVSVMGQSLIGACQGRFWAECVAGRF